MKVFLGLAVFICLCGLGGSATAQEGVWQGYIGAYGITACFDNDKAAYRYDSHISNIALERRPSGWSEIAKGKVTGQWSVANTEPELLKGEWLAGKKKLPLRLQRVSNVAPACSSEIYNNSGVIAPLSPARLTPAGQVAAHDSAVVIKGDGSLWEWGEKTRNVPRRHGSEFVKVAAATHHTLAIKDDGSLWGWGSNPLGQLGGDDVDGSRPVKMATDIVDAAAGERYSFAIKSDGTLWAWGGLNWPGKFGEPEPKPTKPFLIGRGFRAIAARDEHFAAIKIDGTLWMWGQNNDGQLGTGDAGYGDGSYQDRPYLVGRDFAQLSVGSSHTAAIKNDGSLWAWGHNSWGHLGDGTQKPHYVPTKIGDGFQQVVAGFLNTAAVKKDGTLWAWGANSDGLFGDCTTETHMTPTKIGDDFAAVSLGKKFLVAMKRDGSYWTWGWRWDGDQTEVPVLCRKPTQVVFGDGLNGWDRNVARNLLASKRAPVATTIISIAAGSSHSAMVKADGSLWAWGNNTYGQLGDNTTVHRNLPVLVGADHKDVVIDRQHTLALKNDGSFWRWGVTDLGQLARPQPALASVKLADGLVQYLRSGYEAGRGLGLKSDGSLWDWPYYWQIDKPHAKVGHQVRSVASGGFGSYAIRADGSLWELDSYPVKAPLQIGRDFLRIVVGADHAYGVKADGGLWAWGANTFYQLGDGKAVAQASPVKIAEGDFVDVATGRLHGLALKVDGSLWAWGHNENGVIGDGTTITRKRPVQVGSGFSAIAAGAFHSLALKHDGTLWAWGNNEDGQLGDGTTIRRLRPVQVGVRSATNAGLQYPPALSLRAVSVERGLYLSCATLSDGKRKCWGAEGVSPSYERLVATTVGDCGRDANCFRGDMRFNPDRHCSMLSDAKIKCPNRRVVEMPLLRDARKVIADSSNYCGLLRNGKIACQRTDSSNGSIIDGIDDAIDFDFDANTGCAALRDGRVKCWGSNYHGQLGNGTKITDYSRYPVATEVLNLLDK